MITIVDYNMGNLGSIANMVTKAGYESEVSSDLSVINSASKLILPGVGHFDQAMNNIKNLGLLDVIKQKALVDKIPILGICLGMQLMCNKSEEGESEGLGLINAEVKRFRFSDSKLKIPHMGWNTVRIIKPSPLIHDIEKEQRFYFVHSYHIVCNSMSDILTTTNYGCDFVSSFENKNVCGVQFHPEKSHKFGLNVLKNFIEL